MLLFLAAQGLFYFGCLFLIESLLLQRLVYVVSGPVDLERQRQRLAMLFSSHVTEDYDVAKERQRITETPLQVLLESDALVVNELTKNYGDILAVDRLSFGIPRGECFGLLGINGAGKTSTFQMLTGDEMITSGSAYLDGHSIKTDIQNVNKLIYITDIEIEIVFWHMFNCLY